MENTSNVSKTSQSGSPGGIEILYEDNHFIIINKPAGVLSQSDRTGDPTAADSIKDYIRRTRNKQGNVFLGIPHRIDRPTSGILVLARTSKGLSRMTRMFAQKEVKKIYWAVVDSLPPAPEGVLEHSLLRDQQSNKSRAVEDRPPESSARGYDHGNGEDGRDNRGAAQPGGKGAGATGKGGKGGKAGKDKQGRKIKAARLRYKVIGTSDNFYLLEIELETGRHHQIRAQLQAVGCHIKGDLKYGAKRSNPGGGIHLHSRYIEFTHPVSGEPVSVTAPVPDEPLWQYFEKSKEE